MKQIPYRTEYYGLCAFSSILIQYQIYFDFYPTHIVRAQITPANHPSLV